MRYNRGLAQQYRKNGYLFVARDVHNGAYDIFLQLPSGAYRQIDRFWLKGEAIREAKSLAMETKVGFNPDIDVVA